MSLTNLSCWIVSSTRGMALTLTALALCSSLLSLLLNSDSLELCSYDEGWMEEFVELREVFSGVET